MVNSMVGYWSMVISLVCFGSMVNSVVGTLIGLDRLNILWIIWDGWSALSLYHLVNFAWIDYFSLSSIYSKTGSWIFLKISQKLCLDWLSLCLKFSNNPKYLYRYSTSGLYLNLRTRCILNWGCPQFLLFPSVCLCVTVLQARVLGLEIWFLACRDLVVG